MTPYFDPDILSEKLTNFMPSTIGAEIEFFSERDACVSIYRDTNEQFDPKECEILLATLIIFRTIGNFGDDSVGGIKMAELLSHQMISYRNALIEIVEDHSSHQVNLLQQHPGYESKKSFSVHLDYAKMQFDYKMHGFGFFGKGIGSYAPMAVNLLIRKIAESRINDNEFIRLLEAAVVLSGYCGLSGQITMFNQTLQAHALVQLVLLPEFDLDDYLSGNENGS